MPWNNLPADDRMLVSPAINWSVFELMHRKKFICGTILYTCRQLDRHSRPSFKDVMTVLLQNKSLTQPPKIPPKPQEGGDVIYNTSDMIRILSQEDGIVYYNSSVMIRTPAHESQEGGDVYYSRLEMVHTPADYYNTSSYSKLNHS